jgi:hypothetical protein
MLEKIPSLKDFIIYFMPGVLICYFAWDLFNHFSGTVLLITDIAGNSVLVFIGIIFSFLVGFLTSQAQIILYYKILDKKLKPKKTIHGTGWPNEIQDALVAEIRKRMDIPNANSDDLKKDEEIVCFCEQYVLLKTNERGQRFINRSSHLASFACAAVLPVLLGVTDLFLYLGWECCWIVWGLTAVAIALFFLVGTIIYNFKKGWYETIFRQFLVLSKNPTP